MGNFGDWLDTDSRAEALVENKWLKWPYCTGKIINSCVENATADLQMMFTVKGGPKNL
jgi:hypothetical protein